MYTVLNLHLNFNWAAISWKLVELKPWKLPDLIYMKPLKAGNSRRQYNRITTNQPNYKTFIMLLFEDQFMALCTCDAGARQIQNWAAISWKLELKRWNLLSPRDTFRGNKIHKQESIALLNRVVSLGSRHTTKHQPVTQTNISLQINETFTFRCCNTVFWWDSLEGWFTKSAITPYDKNPFLFFFSVNKGKKRKHHWLRPRQTGRQCYCLI